MYLGYGWEDIDKSVIDLAQFGGEGLYPVTAMVRKPRSDD